MAAPEDGEEWKYSVEEVGEDADESDEGDRTNDGPTADRSIEPGDLNPENVLFVVLGVLVALGTLAYGLGII
ncbi:MAG: hypothetical protein QXG03_06490 [Halalkalicoccus sp.]